MKFWKLFRTCLVPSRILVSYPPDLGNATLLCEEPKVPDVLKLQFMLLLFCIVHRVVWESDYVKWSDLGRLKYLELFCRTRLRRFSLIWCIGCPASCLHCVILRALIFIICQKCMTFCDFSFKPFWIFLWFWSQQPLSSYNTASICCFFFSVFEDLFTCVMFLDL